MPCGLIHGSLARSFSARAGPVSWFIPGLPFGTGFVRPSVVYSGDGGAKHLTFFDMEMNKETHQRFIDLACELDEAMIPGEDDIDPEMLSPLRLQRIRAVEAAFNAAVQFQREENNDT